MENIRKLLRWIKKLFKDDYYEPKRLTTYIFGVDPYDDLITTGSCFITHKLVDGKPVAEYKGRPLDVPFPDLMKDMLKFYPIPITKERTDEDVLTELKAIAMFKPEIFKDFLKNDYECIINKHYDV